MDLSKLSDEDLQAIASGDLTKVSDAGLSILGGQAPAQPAKSAAFMEAEKAGRQQALGGGMLGELTKRATDVPLGLAQFGVTLANRVIPGMEGVAQGINERVAGRQAGYDAARMEAVQPKIESLKNDPAFRDMAQRDPRMAQYFLDRELPGTTVAGIFGSLAAGSMIPVARIPGMQAIARVPVVGPLASRAAQSGAMGAIGAQADPMIGQGGQAVTPEQAAQITRERATVGGAMGAALPVLGAGASRLVRPVGGAEVQALREAGIRPTIGQTLGPVARKVEEQAKSIPVLGSAIASAERGAQAEFRQALGNRALANIGETLPRGIDGHELVRHVGDRLSARYDQVLSNITPRRLDTTLAADAQAIRANLRGLPPEVLRDFDAFTGREILSLARKGHLTGDDFKRIESQLGSRERALRTSPDMNARDLADALGDMRGAMREWLARKTPERAAELRAINRGWSELVPIETAASRTGAAASGEFTAAGAYQAAKAANSSVRKRAAGRGEMTNQDLIETAARRLGTREPDSGTAGRNIIGALATGAGGATSIPATVGAIGIGSLPYLARGTVSSLLSGAPQYRNTLADLIQQTSNNPGVGTLGGMMTGTTGSETGDLLMRMIDRPQTWEDYKRERKQ